MNPLRIFYEERDASIGPTDTDPDLGYGSPVSPTLVVLAILSLLFFFFG